MSGTWAYWGGVPPSARITSICLGVLLMWSSPRITRLMPISRSSTAAARLYVGVPSLRATTKSSICAWSKVTVPRIMSSITVSPGSGTAKRHTGVRPSACIAAISSSLQSRLPRTTGACLLARASARMASSSSALSHAAYTAPASLRRSMASR